MNKTYIFKFLPIRKKQILFKEQINGKYNSTN